MGQKIYIYSIFILLFSFLVVAELDLGDTKLPFVQIGGLKKYAGINDNETIIGNWTITGDWVFTGNVTLSNVTVTQINEVNNSNYSTYCNIWDDYNTASDIGTSELNNDANFIANNTDAILTKVTVPYMMFNDTWGIMMNASSDIILGYIGDLI